jgi:hypothetical protein
MDEIAKCRLSYQFYQHKAFFRRVEPMKVNLLVHLFYPIFPVKILTGILAGIIGESRPGRESNDIRRRQQKLARGYGAGRPAFSWTVRHQGKLSSFEFHNPLYAASYYP